MERVHREPRVRHEGGPLGGGDAQVFVGDVHRLPRVALGATREVAAHLRHEELEALPLAALRPRRDGGIGVELWVVHPRVHQTISELGEAEYAADPPIERARVAVDALLRLDKRPRRPLTRLDRFIAESGAGGGLVDALDLENALAAEAEALEALPTRGLLLGRRETEVLVTPSEEDRAAARDIPAACHQGRR